MLIDPIAARNIQVEIFEETTAAGLQDAVAEWLEERVEETVIGMDFTLHGTTADGFQWVAWVLYTE